MRKALITGITGRNSAEKIGTIPIPHKKTAYNKSIEKRVILITGGAGFIGSLLAPELLNRGYKVTVLDNLMYDNGNTLLYCFINNNFRFIKGDIREIKIVEEALKDADIIIHLAAIVGYPACKKDQRIAKEVNLEGTKIINELRSKNQTVIFASTSSNYGHQEDGICTEETPLNPLTLYGETKTQSECVLLETGNAIVFRFATGFGLSPRLRLDLLINDFVFQVLKRKQLIVYEKHYKRAFIHVRDMVRSFAFAIENCNKMLDQVYNVGSDDLNLTKEEIALAIKRKTDFLLHFTDVGRDDDQRNFALSYKKIGTLGFETTVSLEDGLDELIHGLDLIEIKNEYSNI